MSGFLIERPYRFVTNPPLSFAAASHELERAEALRHIADQIEAEVDDLAVAIGLRGLKGFQNTRDKWPDLNLIEKMHADSRRNPGSATQIPAGGSLRQFTVTAEQRVWWRAIRLSTSS